MSRGFWTAIGAIGGAFAGMYAAAFVIWLFMLANCCPGIILLSLIGPVVGIGTGAMLAWRLARRRKHPCGGPDRSGGS